MVAEVNFKKSVLPNGGSDGSFGTSPGLELTLTPFTREELHNFVVVQG